MKRVVRWAGAVFGFIAFVAIVAIGIGIELPISHRAVCSAGYARSPDAVWAATFDDAASLQWRNDVRSIQQVRDDPLRWRETDRYGQSIDYVTSDVHRPIAFVRTIEGPQLAFGGSWSYSIAPGKGGSLLVITEQGEIYNPIFRLMSQFFIGYTATMRRYLTDLGAHFGETVTPSCST